MPNPLVRLVVLVSTLMLVIWQFKPAATAVLLPSTPEVPTIALLLVGLIGLGPLLWSVPIPAEKLAR
jgi:hypothetical protein